MGFGFIHSHGHFSAVAPLSLSLSSCSFPKTHWKSEDVVCLKEFGEKVSKAGFLEDSWDIIGRVQLL
jgi:hypothetical protein